MPTIDENRRIFEAYAWPEGGDEWSVEWGSSHQFFFGTVMPRVATHLPAGHLLELAPGYGRLAQYLIPLCRRYTGVDLARNCVEACSERFAAAEHATFVQNDGRSLGFVEDDTVDFAFSFDSLVHADAEAMAGYTGELVRVLRPGSYAFIHHSNLGEFVDPATGEPTIPNPEFRESTVSAESFRALCRDAGLACLAQELVNWHSPHYTDCISLCRRPPSPDWESPAEPEPVRHPDMGHEAAAFRRLHALYES